MVLKKDAVLHPDNWIINVQQHFILCEPTKSKASSCFHFVYSLKCSSRTLKQSVLVLLFVLVVVISVGLWTSHTQILIRTSCCNNPYWVPKWSGFVLKCCHFFQFSQYLICIDRHVVLNSMLFCFISAIKACSFCLPVCLSNARSGAACCAMRASHCTVISVVY